MFEPVADEGVLKESICPNQKNQKTSSDPWGFYPKSQTQVKDEITLWKFPNRM